MPSYHHNENLSSHRNCLFNTLSRGRVGASLIIPHTFSKQNAIFTQKLTKPFDHKDEDDMHPRDIGNIAQTHTVKQPKNRINVNK
jgi:hypothetical protein